MTFEEAIDQLNLEGVQAGWDDESFRMIIPGHNKDVWSTQEFAGFCEFYFGETPHI